MEKGDLPSAIADYDTASQIATSTQDTPDTKVGDSQNGTTY